jgi:hypothetical protein
VEAIRAETGASEEEAKCAYADESNLGYGISLVNEHAVVIATPLNALRMMQWLRRMREAEPRMLRQNLEKWQRIYAPQLLLFAEALNDFPRAILQEAKELDRSHQLPFPAIN